MGLINIVFRLHLLLVIASFSLSQREQVCKTPECQNRGQMYFRNLKPSVKPCQNFYEFVCGRWMTNFPTKRHISQWGVREVQNKHTFKIFRELLRSTRINPDEVDLKLAKQVFDICSNLPTLPRLSIGAVAGHIRTIGRYPNMPFWVLHEKYLNLTGESILFHPLILANTNQDRIPLLLFVEPVSAYGSVVHVRPWKPEEERAYQNFLFTIMKGLKLGDPDKVIKDRVKAVFSFRVQVDKIIRQYREEHPTGFEPLTPQELQKSFLTQRLSNRQNIPWARLANLLLGAMPRDILNSRKTVGVRHRPFFTELINLMGKTSEEVLAHHMEIYFVESHLLYSDAMMKMLEASVSQIDSMDEHIRIGFLSRWEECIHMYNEQNTLSKLYMKQMYPSSYTSMIHVMLYKIKEAMKQKMKASIWLNENTRRAVDRKLDTLQEWIGSAPWQKNASIIPPDNTDEEDLTSPNAYLDIAKNRIYVSATLLTPPIFELNVPAMYNTAGIGTVMGHELYHIIADCGAYYVSKNNIMKPKIWWSEPMRKACLTRKMCFYNQFKHMTEMEFLHRFGTTLYTADAMKTFIEDSADVMGLMSSYTVFENEKKRDPSTCATLPQFPNYSCEQMFFISFANQYCEYSTLKKTLGEMKVSTHSLNSIRVNGAVANNPDFAKAFNCPVGSPMNPRGKCNLWK